MASLEAYGVHPHLLAAWTRQYNAELLPIQARAVLEGNVLLGTSVIGSGPTGCGKTLIAEMAATHAASQGKHVVYLVPTKALAEAIFDQFQRTYAPLGLRIVISTRDRRSADRSVARGDFDIVVTVPEKLWSVILEAPGLVASIGALVVDELQLVGDPDRGPCLEVLLARFLREGRVQVVGLSAVLSNGRELADWLGARLVEDRHRPVELRKGVWHAGRFVYTEHNSGRRGEEHAEVALPDDASGLETIVALAVELASRGEPTLAFLRDRFSCVKAAHMAAQALRCPRAERALAELAELPRTQATQTLSELLQNGVAFHNADLHYSERQVVEQAFASDEAMCLFATSTLALGVNLPARNVIVDPVVWHSHSGAPTLAAMAQSDFENMAGRAGRLEFGDEFGRAILVADAQFDADTLMARYVEAPPEPVKSQLGRLPEVQTFVMRAALGPGGRLLMDADPHRPGAQQQAQDGASQCLGPSQVRATAQEIAAAAGLVVVSAPGGEPRLTGLGRAAAASGLSLTTVAFITDSIRTLGKAPTNLEALLLACVSLEGRQVPLPRARNDQRWMSALQARAQAHDAWTESARTILWSGPWSVEDRELAARVALLVLDWTSDEATPELERICGVHAGRALAVCEAVGWLVQCVARFCGELAVNPAEVDRLERWGEAIAAALPEECLPLWRMRLASLQRDHVLALWGAGLASPGAVLGASQEELRRWVPARARTEIRRMARATRGHVAAQVLDGPPTPPASAASSSQPPAVRASSSSRSPAHSSQASHTTPNGSDLMSTAPGSEPDPKAVLVLDKDRPDVALVYGHAVQLRPMEFQLLNALAKQPRKCVTFDHLYYELWGAQGEVEPQQIYWHKHKLCEKLATVLPPGTPMWVRTVPKRGLILDLPRDQVRAA